MVREIFVRTVGWLPRGLIRRVGLLQARNGTVRRCVSLVRGMVRDHDMTIHQGVGAGLRFQTGDSNFGYVLGTSEPQTQDALTRFVKPGAVVYDIGCNVGFVTVLCARLAGPDGHVYAFDPVPKHAALVRHNAASNDFHNVTAYECAVSSSTGKAQLWMDDISARSRLEGYFSSEEKGRMVPVAMITIDGMIEQQQLRAPTFVKIDVEGAEVEALKGMSRTLREHRPVLICDTHATHKEVAEVLEAHGYWCGTIERVELPLAEADYFAHALAVPMERKEAVLREMSSVAPPRVHPTAAVDKPEVPN
ncbi:MAG: FkbM family methyltransferase [Tepidisphaeraceae bacterium]